MATPMVSTETVEIITVCDAESWTFPADRENMIRTSEVRDYVNWLNEVIALILEIDSVRQRM